MNQLRHRFEVIQRIRNDPIRVNEDATLVRLLYKNRNQHKHGLYFKRLEHVSRLLAKVNNHDVWTSVQNALSNHGKQLQISKRASFVSISSVTLADLKAVETLLDNLSRVILTASNKVTIELVSRQHFLPFALTVLAVLSRIFVIGQRLLSEIRGAVVETKLLLTESTTTTTGINPNGSKDAPKSEDVGQALEETKEVSRDIGIEPERQTTPPNAKTLVSQLTTVKIPDLKNVRRERSFPTADMAETQKPSLYKLLVEHRGAPSDTAHIKPHVLPFVQSTRISATTDANVPPPSVSFHTQKKRRVEVSNMLEHAPSVIRRSDLRRDFATMDVVTEGKPVSTTKPMSSREENNLRPDDESSGESEDLDDIFGALDE